MIETEMRAAGRYTSQLHGVQSVNHATKNNPMILWLPNENAENRPSAWAIWRQISDCLIFLFFQITGFVL